MKVDNTISVIARIHDNAYKVIVSELKKRGYEGLAPSHGDIISTLLKNDELTKTEISSKINRDRSTVTTLLKKLKKNGYIDCKVNEEDSRSSLVFLTQKGKEMEKDFIEISELLYEIQYQHLGKSEIDSFRAALKTIARNFAEY